VLETIFCLGTVLPTIITFGTIIMAEGSWFN